MIVEMELHCKYCGNVSKIYWDKDMENFRTFVEFICDTCQTKNRFEISVKVNNV